MEFQTNQKQVETKKCKHCGMDIPAQAKVCPYCNKKQKHTVRNVLLIILGVVILLNMLFSCMGSGGSDTSDTEQTTETETIEQITPTETAPAVAQGDTAVYQSYADQAKAYFNEIVEIANSLRDSGQTNMDDVTAAYDELANRITQTELEIPENTDDQVLRIERAMFDQLAKIALLPSAQSLTGASTDEFTQTLDKNIAEYKTLTEQIPEYYKAE